MLNAAGLKKNATLFRKNAQKMELPFSLCQLLDIYAYAHYGRAYAAAHRIADEQLLPLPVFPAPFLSMAAERYDIDEADLLDVLDVREGNPSAREPYAINVSADLFTWSAKCFRIHAADQGIKLKMTAANDLFSRAHFDRPYSAIVGLLRSGNAEAMDLEWCPAFLGAACAFYNVDPDNAYQAFEMVAQDTLA